MASAKAVQDEMRAKNFFSEEELDAITDELVNEGIKNAQSLPKGQYPRGISPIGTIWSGNHFRIVNGVWHWEDQRGSQCGRRRTWRYRPKPGAWYQRTDRCPQGYYWYQIFVL